MKRKRPFNNNSNSISNSNAISVCATTLMKILPHLQRFKFALSVVANTLMAFSLSFFRFLQMNPGNSNSNNNNKNNDSSCSSSNTEDYNEIEDRRRRIKNRSR